MKTNIATKIILLLIVSISPLLFSCSHGRHQCSHERVTSELQAPTCDKTGTTVNTCALCGEVFLTDTELPLGHRFITTTVPPTCESLGYDEHTCLTCGFTYASNYESALGHAMSVSTVAPTCNATGHSLAECQLCGYSCVFDTVAPLGHSFEESRSLVSARKQTGSTAYVCECGFSYVGDFRFYSDIFHGAHVSNTEVLAKGIDVSYHNHNLSPDGAGRLPLDWVSIREAGYEFAILRAGYRNKADVTFEMDYAAAKAAGLEVGAYFYSYATSVAEARAEALFCLTLLEGKQFEYPIFFDIEDPSLKSIGEDTLTQICVEFISTLQENGYYAALYTNNNWLTNVLHTQKIITLFDVWYARFPSATEIITQAEWNAEKYGKQMALWQFSQTGVISGLVRPNGDPIYFDLNYAYRDYPTLIKELGYNGY